MGEEEVGKDEVGEGEVGEEEAVSGEEVGIAIISGEGEAESDNPPCDNTLGEDVTGTDEVGECIGMETILEVVLDIASLNVRSRIVEFPKDVFSETVSLSLKTRSLANSFSSRAFSL